MVDYQYFGAYNICMICVKELLQSKFALAADKYYNSIWYSITICCVAILCHTLNIPIVGAAIFTVLLSGSLVFSKNSYVLVPFLMMCSFVISQETMPQSGYYNSGGKIAVLCILLVFIVAALVFNLVYYKKWRLVFKRAYLTVSLCILTAALLLGGITTETYTISGVMTCAAIALTMFLPYTLLINCGEYQGEKTVRYIAWALIAASVAIGAAVLKQYALNDFDMTDPKEYLFFGYAISNTGAAFVVLAMPLTFYLAYKSKYGYLYLLLCGFELVVVAFTFSRASLIVAVPGVLLVATVLCFKKIVGRLGYLITYGIALAALVAFVIVFWDKIFDKIVAILDNKISSSGRIELWKNGFNAWKNKPMLGVGIWFLRAQGIRYYSFHCTPLTYLYCMGVIGFAAYAYHRYKTVRLVFSARLTPERVFTALSVLAMLLNALLDIGMTSPPHLLYYAALLVLIEHDVEYVKKAAAQENGAVPHAEPDSSAVKSVATENQAD